MRPAGRLQICLHTFIGAGSLHQGRKTLPRSKIKLELVKRLKQEGCMEGFIDVAEGPQGQIKIFLRYDAANRGVIRGLDRVSKPGCRKYVGRDEIPRVRNGLGLAILTTPKGVLTGQQALHAGVGGELLCYVW